MTGNEPNRLPAVRFLQLVSALGGTFVICSCQVSESTMPLRAPTTAQFSGGASQTWVRSSFFINSTLTVPCLGEDVHVFGEAPFESHEVTSGSGVYNFHLLFPPLTPNTPQFYAQGVTSGKLFQYKNGGPVTQTVHLAAGEVQLTHDKETFVAVDGSKLFFEFISHVTLNANGVVTVSRLDEIPLGCSRK
jgi:hypothetical protein